MQDIEKGKLEMKLMERQIRNYDLQNIMLEIDIDKKSKGKKKKLNAGSPKCKIPTGEQENQETNIIEEAFHASMRNDILGVDSSSGDMSYVPHPENPLVWHLSKKV